VTLERKLHDTARRVRTTTQASNKAREDRDAAVREALKAGWTHAKIAETTGMTRGRVGQLAQRFNQS
jgi:hypothetical protein